MTRFRSISGDEKNIRLLYLFVGARTRETLVIKIRILKEEKKQLVQTTSYLLCNLRPASFSFLSETFNLRLN